MSFFRCLVVLVIAVSVGDCSRLNRVPVKRASFEMRLVDETKTSGKKYSGNRSTETYYLEPDILVDEKDIEDAEVTSDFNGQAVLIKMTSGGTTKFAGITGKNHGRRLAIIVDGAVLIAPIIQTEISNGKIMINGIATQQEAENLARSLSGK